MFSSFAQALISDTKGLLPGSPERATRRRVRDAIRNASAESDHSRSPNAANRPTVSATPTMCLSQLSCSAMDGSELASTAAKQPRMQAAALREVIADLVAENQRLQSRLDTEWQARPHSA